jgi:transposase, IS30 family
MTKYSHLSQEQRYQIEALLKAGNSPAKIAVIVGCHRSTICRELKRNSLRGNKPQYLAARAQEKTMDRHRVKKKMVRFTQEMREQIVRGLQVEKLSPELISVRGRQRDPNFVSDETIYKWVWACKYDYRQLNRQNRKLYKLLKHSRKRRYRGSKRDSRGIIHHRVSIDKRPSIVEKRERVGDLEVDLMLGRNHQPGLLVILDRSSLKTSLVKIETRDPNTIATQIIRRMKKSSPWIKTMTYDNDISFRYHQRVNEALNVKSYFTHPFSSQEKGSVENRIGQIRRFFPKKTDFTMVSKEQIKAVEKMINARPVRKFNYRTPQEIFEEKMHR